MEKNKNPILNWLEDKALRFGLKNPKAAAAAVSVAGAATLGLSSCCNNYGGCGPQYGSVSGAYYSPSTQVAVNYFSGMPSYPYTMGTVYNYYGGMYWVPRGYTYGMLMFDYMGRNYSNFYLGVALHSNRTINHAYNDCRHFRPSHPGFRPPHMGGNRPNHGGNWNQGSHHPGQGNPGNRPGGRPDWNQGGHRPGQGNPNWGQGSHRPGQGNPGNRPGGRPDWNQGGHRPGQGNSGNRPGGNQGGSSGSINPGHPGNTTTGYVRQDRSDPVRVHYSNSNPRPNFNTGNGPRPNFNTGNGPRPNFNTGGGPRPNFNTGNGPRPNFNTGGGPRPQYISAPRQVIRGGARPMPGAYPRSGGRHR